MSAFTNVKFIGLQSRPVYIGSNQRSIGKGFTFTVAICRPTGSALAVVVASLIGLVYATTVLGPSVAFGSSEYWRWPRGLAGGLHDIRMMMSGYYWFVNDAWRWPLFYIPQPNAPIGANAVLIDPIPFLALSAKMIRSITGTTVNLFPLWVTCSFMLGSASLAALVRGLGQRSLLAAVLAGGLGALAPVLHHRFGHLGLSGHWEFVFALALYARASAPGRSAVRAGTGFVLLCALAFATHLYIYVMTAAVAAAFLLQAGADRRLSPLAAASGIAGVLGSGGLLLWVFGLGGSADLASITIPFGKDSMNLLAPFWPQTSGAFSWTGLYLLTRGSIGATTGQYEGYCYIGLGALTALCIAAVRHGGVVPALVRKHWALSLALSILALWAISNQIYLGPILLASYPLPRWLLDTVLAWFRAEGRFFWPMAWLLVALGVAGTLASLRPRAAVAVTLVALSLQWIDLALWRGQLAGVTSGPSPTLGTQAFAAGLEREIARRGRAAVAPSIDCNLNAGGDYDAADTVAAMEVQLIAARANAVMPAITASRSKTDCAKERATPLRDLAGDGVILVLNQPEPLDRRREANLTLSCQPVAVGLVCATDALREIAAP